MVDRRKTDNVVSPADMVNRRVDKELEGYARAFEMLEKLKTEEEQDEAESRAEAERNYTETESRTTGPR